MTKHSSAFNALLSLSRQFTETGRGLPAQEDIVPTRKVACFSLLGLHLVMALEELTEIIELPPCTRLPRVNTWVLGVANLRGRLLPVINFAEFLGGALSAPPKAQRVLVIDMMGIFIGLVVDRVYDMRHFGIDTFRQQLEGVPEVLSPYAEGGFVQADKTWVLLRPGQLLSDQCFMEVAV
jgi:twitching motility protein PilI